MALFVVGLGAVVGDSVCAVEFVSYYQTVFLLTQMGLNTPELFTYAIEKLSFTLFYYGKLGALSDLLNSGVVATNY